MLPNIPKILNESHTILRASERCAEVFQDVPLVSYSRARNLSDMLVSKRLAPHTSTKTLPTQNHQNSQNSTATSQIKPDSPTKAPHPAPTSVPNVASYSRNRRVSKSIKHPSTRENKTHQPHLDSGLATLTTDARSVNHGCSIPPSPAQIMAISTSSNSL